MVETGFGGGPPGTRKPSPAAAPGNEWPGDIHRGARQLRGRIARFFLALIPLVAGLAATSARAQDPPAVISPLKVEPDHNGVNLVNGKIAIQGPSLSVPGAPNLRFDRIQNAAPYIKGTVAYSLPDSYGGGGYSVHLGAETSESFQCYDIQDCQSVTGSGSTLRISTEPVGNFTFVQAGSGATYKFNSKHSHTMGNSNNVPGTVLYYLGHITYPNGETISYNYDTVFDAGVTNHRPNSISSSAGYFITISYHTDTYDANNWWAVKEAAIYSSAAPTVPLGKLSYSLAGAITDHGGASSDGSGGSYAGRTYLCQSCNNHMAADLEVAVGWLRLPGESAFALQAVPASTSPVANALVSSVVKNGVTWNYTYGNLRYSSTASGYIYDTLTVSGPDGFNNTYAYEGPGQNRKGNTIASKADSLSRLTSFYYDAENGRPTRIVFPELNEVSVLYDGNGNISQKTTKPKPNSGAPIVEIAQYPETCASAPALCYRPTAMRDGLLRWTYFEYNDKGQLTKQTDPAVNGVSKVTNIEYESVLLPSGQPLSRKKVVRVCCATNPDGTSYELRTEYDYWGYTLLPIAERRIDTPRGVTLTTTFTYDSAGRQLSADGPLPGTDDAVYSRYDMHGRKTWEIGARAPNGLRIAKRHYYRVHDDLLEKTEIGTLPDAASTALTVSQRTDYAYDSRRNRVRETLVAGITHSVVQRSFDNRGRLECEAQRMNPATFASLPASACTLSTLGPEGGPHGPDRITRNTYDAGAQLLKVERAYGVTTANGFPATLQQDYARYEYTLNGKQKAVIDANGNRAELTWDGYDRQRRWIFPSKTTPGLANGSATGITGDFEEYSYDLVGNRTRLRKRDGKEIDYAYDARDRLILKTVPASATGAAGYSVHYGYDVRGLQTYARFGSATGTGITSGYDGFGRQLTSTSDMGGTLGTTTYQYDAASNRIGDGGTTIYDYDALGRMTRIKLAANGTELASFSYDNLGRRSLLTLGTSLTRSSVDYDHDAAGRLERITRDLNGPGDQVLTFAYNPASQIVTRTSTSTNDIYASNTAENIVRPYSANGLNQYSQAGTPGTLGWSTFTYDDNGNVKSVTTQIGANSYATTNYVYDTENRLVSASGAKTASLAYDPLGRLWQVSGGSAGTTRFGYDGDKLVAEADAAGVVKRFYTHGPGVDEPIVWWEIGAGNQRRYYHADHQGSIVAVADLNGNLIAANAYDSWGLPNAGNLGRFGYTGQAWIPELEMNYYKARFYSPTLGRFMQVDPIGYDDDVNLYAYVGNDPLNGSDPTGMAGCGTRISWADSASCSGQTLLSFSSSFAGAGDAQGGSGTKARSETRGDRIERLLRRDPDVRRAMHRARAASRVDSKSASGKLEYGFWLRMFKTKSGAIDFEIGDMIGGDGALYIDPNKIDRAYNALPGAQIFLHIHPNRPGENGATSIGISAYDEQLAGRYRAAVVVLSRPNNWNTNPNPRAHYFQVEDSYCTKLCNGM